jgi:hypothetical protein
VCCAFRLTLHPHTNYSRQALGSRQYESFCLLLAMSRLCSTNMCSSTAPPALTDNGADVYNRHSIIVLINKKCPPLIQAAWSDNERSCLKYRVADWHVSLAGGVGASG